MLKKNFNKHFFVITVLTTCLCVLSVFLIINYKSQNKNEFGHWTKTANLLQPRADCGAALMDNGNVLIAGGRKMHEVDRLYTSEIYDVKNNKFFPGPNLNQKRTSFTLVKKTNGDIAALGGLIVARPSVTNEIETYKKDDNIFVISGHTQNPILGYPLLLENNNILIVENDFNLYVYNMLTNQSKKVNRKDIQSNVSSFSVIPMKNNDFYILGGIYNDDKKNKTIISNAIYKFKAKTNELEKVGELLYPRYRHSSILLPDGNILTVGGQTTLDANMLDKEVFENNLYKRFKRNLNDYYYWKTYMQVVELFDVKTHKSRVVGKLNYAIGSELKLFIFKNRYILVLNGSGAKDEVIDLKDYKIYPINRSNPITTCGQYVQIAPNKILTICNKTGALNHGMIFQFTK